MIGDKQVPLPLVCYRHFPNDGWKSCVCNNLPKNRTDTPGANGVTKDQGHILFHN